MKIIHNVSVEGMTEEGLSFDFGIEKLAIYSTAEITFRFVSADVNYMIIPANTLVHLEIPRIGANSPDSFVLENTAETAASVFIMIERFGGIGNSEIYNGTE